MAFRQYQLVQTKSFLNNHPEEVPKHQPDVGFPVNDDQSVSVELSLGLGVSGSTSSITKQSSLPIMKRLSPSKHMELVNAARSFSLYLTAEDNDSFIKFSSSEKSSLDINKRLMTPQDKYPTYKDVLATQVNGPMRKRKISSKRIEFGQLAAEQLNEPNKKKRKLPEKINCGPIVKNEVTEQLESYIRETLKGSEIKLVIQKLLYRIDTSKSQIGLNLLSKQLETKDFLTDEEKKDLKSGKEIVVQLLGPTLRMHDEPVKLKIQPTPSTKNYVLMSNWKIVLEENNDYLKHQATIQVWSFRVDQQLCFALAVVERPMANEKINCGPIVKNEVTEQLESYIRETLKGSEIKLVIQKLLYKIDTSKSQIGLNLLSKQLETKDFLTDEEKKDLKSGKEIVVQLLGPTLRMHDEPVKLKIQPTPSTKNYVLMSNWKIFLEENKDYLKHLSTIQLWSFRVDRQLCFALAVVERPMANGVNEVA
ncbi:hypothetical protein CTI12_AA589940 [Artemisia annua]|uniref:B3 domain-containing protein n=1 Tax=Artemisia annua TaxID=35608 RepID=A0A2U1KL50_ARTAN|nr:hypothetical protein CTI12_AA589940 [Artemisia annua]